MLLAGVLSGCNQTLPGAPTGNPAVGECHLIVSPEQFDAVSEPSPPVACGEAHTAQTYKVTQVPAPLSGQGTRPGQQELKALTARLCDVASLRKYLAAGERDGTTGLAIAAYAPSRDDWERGARAMRCDVLLATNDGTPRTTTLDFKGMLTGPDSAALRLCYRQELADGQLSDDGVDVPCTEPHTAEDISAWFNLESSVATPAARNARCLPYALQFLGVDALPAGITLRPIIRTVNGARTVRCAVAPFRSSAAQSSPTQSSPGTITGTLAPAGGQKRG
ncbi:septum formation family protein [Arthrobacter sp. B2a2-09]|uniref:septum formation family protein n=1 Tax=Arthrobacter sp. B2a2-09 TaxID=2952822 RepID=UPI0022CD44B5|nr:septum formation family protein [Arthrobacter sp. B2a2-09]MCZ9884278.1 septum formation family protein [Arthrobacter sp. B2a2-09]